MKHRLYYKCLECGHVCRSDKRIKATKDHRGNPLPEPVYGCPKCMVVALQRSHLKERKKAA